MKVLLLIICMFTLSYERKLYLVALKYYKKAIKNPYVDMNEFILVQTLTGLKDLKKVNTSDNKYLKTIYEEVGK